MRTCLTLVAALAASAVAPPAAAADIVHNYAPLCADPSALGPGPGEEGHLVATRLTPTSAPFTVATVRAKLHHGHLQNAECVATGAHRISLWLGTDAAPQARPEIVAVLTFGEEEVLGDERWLSAPLDTPITLAEGQALWASVDFGGTHPNVGCIATCRSGPAPNATFWSNGNQAPYDWQPLEAFGISADLWVEAVGSEPAEEPPTEPARRRR